MITLNPFELLRRRSWKRIKFAFPDAVAGKPVWYWYCPHRDKFYMATGRYQWFKSEVTQASGERLRKHIEEGGFEDP